MKLLRNLLGLLILLAVVGGAGWFYWTTTPQHAVSQIKEAVKMHNVELFQQYVDVDATSQGIVQDLVFGEVHKLIGRGMLAELIVGRIMEIFRSELDRAVSRQLMNYVRSGDFSPPGDDPEPAKVSLKNLDNKLGFTGHAFKSIKQVTSEGDTAKVSLELHNEQYNTDLELDLKLQKSDKAGWKLVSISNLDDFVRTLLKLQSSGSATGATPASNAL